MLTLPFELRTAVFSLLSQEDLLKCAIISKELLPAARSLIYRTVHLKSDNQNLASIAKILESNNHDLAARVRHAKLTTVKPLDVSRKSGKSSKQSQGQLPTKWLDAKLLSSFVALRSLTLVGSPFADEEEQEDFVKAVTKSMIHLESFTYTPGRTQFPNPHLNLENLKRVYISLYSERDLEPQMISLLTASSRTLESLEIKYDGSLKTDEIKIKDTTYWKPMLSLHFPRLRRLVMEELDPYAYHPPLSIPRNLTYDFVSRHLCLQELILGTVRGHYNYPLRPLLSDDFRYQHRLDPSFLASLQYLDCSASDIRVMINMNVKSITNSLKLLIVRDGGDLPEGACLPNLETLHLLGWAEYTETAPRLRSHRKMKALLNACPALKYFESRMMAIIMPKEFAKMYADNKNIEVIDISQQLIFNRPGDYVGRRPMSITQLTQNRFLEDHGGLEAFFAPLAAQCPHMRRVIVRGSDQHLMYILRRKHQNFKEHIERPSDESPLESVQVSTLPYNGYPED